MKLIAISLSDDCVQSPACLICYIRGRPKREYNSFGIVYHTPLQSIREEFRKAKNNRLPFPPRVAVCVEYSGYNLSCIHDFDTEVFNLTMTTMPKVVTPVFCGFIKAHGVQAIAISYDSYKCQSVAEWTQAAQIAKSAGLKVSCNYLVEKLPFEVPTEILEGANQLNFLAQKPSGEYTKLQRRYMRVIIEMYKSMGVKVAVDNCLGVQMGFIKSCQAGKDFIHINPDGTVEPCCFKDLCYLWKDINETTNVSR